MDHSRIVGMIQFLAKCPHCAQLRTQTRSKSALIFEVANLEPIECSCTVCNRRWRATARDLARIDQLLRGGVRAVVWWAMTAPIYLADLNFVLMA